MIDVDKMRRIAECLFVPAIHDAFGDDGTQALRELLAFLPRLYSVLSPDQVAGTLIVFRALPQADAADAVTGSGRSESRLERLPRQVLHVTALELRDNGDVRIWEDAAVDLDRVTAMAVVYRFRPGNEDFIVRAIAHSVLNPAAAHLSIFARPTFSSLADALADYRSRLVRTSTCYIFREAWETKNRIFFRPGPESLMRRSLQQYLYSALRDVDVLVEQVVDESHPVDVKVLWNFTRSEALIEIKWLGRSRLGKKFVSYSESRANDGARQLADYLDSYRTTNPNVVAKGYLVVVDGRRRRAADPMVISTEDGMYYEHREIAFSPRYHETRTDFAPPVRMFAEPICTDGTAA